MTSYRFLKGQSLSEFQSFIEKIYALPDDRLYSIWDLLTHQQRFAMRALKGIRKDDTNKTKLNLLISLAWLCALSNRLHINIEEEVLKRFPMCCSYCGKRPCACKKIRPKTRLKIKPSSEKRPQNLEGLQKLFQAIYPRESRTLEHAGIHLAEEMGEINEAVHAYLGQHQESQFLKVKEEIADFVSCSFGVANSARFDVAKEYARMFKNNCHVCHKAPCVCSFTSVARIKT